jgi:hypothetical protein
LTQEVDQVAEGEALGAVEFLGVLVFEGVHGAP